jgi:hypothetical protein
LQALAIDSQAKQRAERLKQLKYIIIDKVKIKILDHCCFYGE